MVPVFTVVRSTEEEPDSVPAASPRLPRSNFTVVSRPADLSDPGVPHRRVGGCAPLPAQIRQIRAGAR